MIGLACRRTPCIPTLAAAVILLLSGAPAWAAAPATYGWWTQTSIGGAGQSTQPDVPADGMLVQNGPTGPVAVSALSFTVPTGSEPGKLTLSVSGQAVITQPPIACPATTPVKSAEGGPWSDRPGYDCSHPIAGSINAASTEVQFTVGKLVQSQTLAVVIVAGGATDRVAFNKPGADALSETSGTSGAPAAASNPAPQTDFQPPAAAAPVQQAPFPQFPNVPAAAAPAAGNPAVVAVAPPARPPAVTAAGGGGTAQAQSVKHDLANVVLLPVLLLALLYWTDGFGAFGLRRSLATRRVGAMP
jgi:hypothetical protein